MVVECEVRLAQWLSEGKLKVSRIRAQCISPVPSRQRHMVSQGFEQRISFSIRCGQTWKSSQNR